MLNIFPVRILCYGQKCRHLQESSVFQNLYPILIFSLICLNIICFVIYILVLNRKILKSKNYQHSWGNGENIPCRKYCLLTEQLNFVVSYLVFIIKNKKKKKNRFDFCRALSVISCNMGGSIPSNTLFFFFMMQNWHHHSILIFLLDLSNNGFIFADAWRNNSMCFLLLLIKSLYLWF